MKSITVILMDVRAGFKVILFDRFYRLPVRSHEDQNRYLGFLRYLGGGCGEVAQSGLVRTPAKRVLRRRTRKETRVQIPSSPPGIVEAGMLPFLFSTTQSLSK